MSATTPHAPRPHLLFIALHLLLGCGIAAAQPDASPPKGRPIDPAATLPPALVAEDIRTLKRALEEAHPGLYRHIGKSDLDTLFARAIESATAPMTYAEFTRHITPLVTAIGCAHTIILPSDAYDAYAASARKIFPFGVRLIGGKLYLLRNYSDNDAIAPGAEIEKINGTPVAAILPIILSSYSSDGDNRTSAMRWTDDEGFAEMYALSQGTPDTFAIQLRQGDAPSHEVVVAALPPTLMRKNRARRYGNPADTLLWFTIDRPKSTALLTLRSFHRPLLQSQGLVFEAFIDSAFREFEAAGITNLILDIRGNRGGSTHLGALLYSYLGEGAAFRYIDDVETARRTAPPFNPRMPWGDSSDFRATGDGRFSVVTHPDLAPMQPNPRRFKGKLYVMIDGATFSSAGIFAAYLDAHREATFVGEESGSDYYAIGGYPVRLALPNSGAKIMIPGQLYRYNTGLETGRAGHGVIPDYPFEPTIADLIAGTDSELAYVKERIRIDR